MSPSNLSARGHEWLFISSYLQKYVQLEDLGHKNGILCSKLGRSMSPTITALIFGNSNSVALRPICNSCYSYWFLKHVKMKLQVEQKAISNSQIQSGDTRVRRLIALGNQICTSGRNDSYTRRWICFDWRRRLPYFLVSKNISRIRIHAQGLRRKYAFIYFKFFRCSRLPHKHVWLHCKRVSKI